MTSSIFSIEQVFVYVLAASLAMARMTGVLVVAPFFTRLGVTGIVRGAIALALALPLVPVLADVSGAQPAVGVIAVLLVKEVIVGVLLGLVFGVPFWAAEGAGDILDLQRGSTLATLADPSSATEASITGTLMTVVMLALFFASGGLRLVMRGVYDSYGLWPAGQMLPVFGAEASVVAFRLMDDVMRMALLLVSPIVIALLLADLVLALLSRAAPQLHVFDLSLSAKNLLFAGLMVVYCSFLMEYARGDLAVLLDASAVLREIAPAQR